MEMFIMMLLIIMCAIVITYSKELYIYVSLVLGSLMNDILNKLNKFIGKK